MLETNAEYPLIVEVTMYKHNLGDNRLLSLVKRNARLSKINNSNNHFFVSCNDVQEILTDNFQDDLDHQYSLNDTKLANDITSAYFLDSVMLTFKNLKYIKFNVSTSKNYTRRVGDTVSFDYKILHAKIDLPSLISLDELKSIQNLLIDIKFWSNDVFSPNTFIEISSRDLISQINYHEGSDNFIENHNLAIELLLNLIDIKLESDDASIHLIVMA
jgi:hypothetical protein